MPPTAGYRLPRLLLPAAGVDLSRWAVIACDQYTAEPEYWEQAAAFVGGAPSTLELIFPEVHLEAPDAAARIGRIQAAMQHMLETNRLREHAGAVLVERTVGGRTRRGLMLELDLEHYDYSPESTSLVRPTEGTIVARLAPRIAVRRGAALELPHILVLIDDPGRTVIEPLATARDRLAPLYDTELMLGGGHVAGFALDAAQGEQVMHALAALAEPARFEQRYGVAHGTPPMLFAVGDGNHSLATAKATWEEIKRNDPSAGPNHPARWALVEVENIHDPALEFEPIHRLLFGVTADLNAALAGHFGTAAHIKAVSDAAAMRERVRDVLGAGVEQAAGLVRPAADSGPAGSDAPFSVVEFGPAASALAVGTVQDFIDHLIASGGAKAVDYVHGDDVLERLAQQPGSAGFHLGTVSKSELLRRVVQGGPLPRKTFSMGEAHEKRYYVEARRIR